MLDLTTEDAQAIAFLARLVALWRAEMTRSVETELLHQILKETRQMSDMIMTELTRLQTDVAAQSTIIASATTAFQGLAAQLAAAESAAKNAGATDMQIANLVAVRQGLESNTASLAAAIPANTPAMPTPAAVTVPGPVPGSVPGLAAAAGPNAPDANTLTPVVAVPPANISPTT